MQKHLEKFDPNNLKIAHKGFVLASIPLVLGLIFLGTLMYLLDQAEREAQREMHAQSINYESNLSTQQHIEAVSSMTTYAFTQQKIYLDRYKELVEQANDSYKTLLALVQDDPDEVRRVDHMRAVQVRLFRLLDQFQESRSRSLTEGMNLLAIMGMKEQMQSLMQEYLQAHAELREAEKTARAHRLHDPAESRLRVTQFIWLGVLATILIGVYLIQFFSRSITTRIDTVIDNAMRLAAKQSLRPILAGTDEIARLDVMFHDMAFELEAAARRERAIVDNAVDVICSLDSSNRFTQVSPACLSVWGYQPEELIGRRLADIVSSDDSEKTLAALKLVSESHTSTSCENAVCKRDNNVVDMLWSMYWSAQEEAYFCVAHDITERKVAEDLLRESEARIKLIIESLPVALIISDSEGMIETSNVRTEQMFGYGDEELCGSSLNALLNFSGQPAGADFLKNIREKSLGKVSELDALRKDGSRFPVELSVTEFEYLGAPKLLAVALDVTERHEIERLKQEFVQMVSHDLRSPLTSIQGMLSLFHAGIYGEVNDKGKKTLERSESDISRLIGLIDELLDLERMQAGKMHIDYRATELASVVARSVSAVSYLASKKNIEIAATSVPLEILADSSKLVQVIVNLLSNAIKFSPPDSTITVHYEESPEFVEVMVRDQGRGIPDSLKETIFERFRQVEHADYKEKGGRGLGLAICKAIVESHGGTIGVNSEEGKGSTFWFRIPQPN